MVEYSSREMMVVTASRTLKSADVCFVGIGAPSEACNLARLTHAHGITLVYESGTIGTKPKTFPLSIGDSELAETALTTVSVPETFQYWLQGGRITVGFLGAAQLDRYANINTTVIGEYATPKVRLPGGGGAPEITGCCGEVYVIITHDTRHLVREVDFITSLGFGRDGKERDRLGIDTKGPTRVITDLCVLEPDIETKELIVASIHPGVSRELIEENTGWPVRFFESCDETPPPTQDELATLRQIHSHTESAHRRMA